MSVPFSGVSSVPPEEYHFPSVTVDAIVFTIRQQELQVALIKRGIEPFEGSWAIPGGFVRRDESLEEAVRRELHEEVGVEGIYLEQLYTFGEPDRDPRGRVITVAYFALVAGDRLDRLTASADAAEAHWFPVNKLPDLAFDHRKIMDIALDRLRSKLEYSTIAWALLPKTFRLTELQSIYETIFGRALDKRNFRKKMLSLGLLEETAERSQGAFRPAVLYAFNGEKVAFF